MIKTTRLAHSGLDIAPLTFGCWELGGGQWEKESDEQNTAAIQTALSLGMTNFDTAEGYGNGHSEEIVGMALEGRRRDCVIATKVSPDHLRASDVRRSVEMSLKRLRTDYIDIYYIHWPNRDIPLSETMTELRALQEEGIIKAIGASNFSVAQLQEAMQVAYIDVIQPEYSLLHRSIEQDVIPYCIANGMGILSYSSIAKGILTGVYHLGNVQIKESDFRAKRRLFLPEHLEKETELIHVLKRMADSRQVSLAEIAISWLLHQPGVTSTIVGTQSINHLKENIRALAIVLTEQELQELSAVSSKTIASIDGQ